MIGITNAPQGSGGSGGEWTERAADNDWSDLFEIESSRLIAKKDIYFVSGTYISSLYIPKGAKSSSQGFVFPLTQVSAQPTYLDISSRIKITTGSIASTQTSLSVDTTRYTFTYDNGTVKITTSTINVTQSKSNITIYVKE